MKHRIFSTSLILQLAALVFPVSIFGANSTGAATPPARSVFKGDPTTALNFKGDLSVFLTEYSRLTTEAAWKILDIHPPSTRLSDERWLALLAIDGIFHNDRIDATNAFADFYEIAASRVLRQLERGRPKSGFLIHRFYNHGFIIQTPSATIGIDLIRGGMRDNYKGRKLISDGLMRKIVAHLDILLVSHFHRDHADLFVADLLAEKSRPVIAPTGLWEDVSPHILNLRDEVRNFPNKDGNASLRVRIHPGFQRQFSFNNPEKDAPNNVYEVTTSEGFTFVHTGDYWVEGDENDMIAGIGDGKKVDVFFVNTWGIRYSSTYAAAVNRLSPALVISSHENECGHPVVQREPYFLDPRILARLTPPTLIMVPGETYASPSER